MKRKCELMDIELARKITQRIRRGADLLTSSLTIVKPSLNVTQFTVYAHQIGTIVGEIGFELLFPIYAEFPELDPQRNHGIPGSDVQSDLEHLVKPGDVALTVRRIAHRVHADMMAILSDVHENSKLEEAMALEQRIQKVTLRLTELRVPEAE
jgi:hypothetical protein